MGTSILSINATSASTSTQLYMQKSLASRDKSVDKPTDILDIGKGQKLTSEESMQIVVERAMDKLRSVVSDARAALGIPEDTEIDTSAEATGNRIADFALGAFDKWAKNHSGLADEDARQQFADFIGGAIQQGISEARGILGALNALTGEVDTNINSTWDVIQNRLNDFIGNTK